MPTALIMCEESVNIRVIFLRMFDKEPSAAEDKNVENPKGAEDRWEEDEEINVVENGIESAVPGNHSSTLGVEPIPNSQPTYPPRPGRKRSPYGGRERNGRDRSSRGEHKLVGYRRPYRLRVRKHARGRRRIRGGRYGRERWRY